MKNDTSLFLDEAKINIKAGDGGAGIVSFFVLKGSHKKIASGGSGGKGGDVVFKATSSMSTLYSFKKKIHFKAENGQQGMPNNRQGRRGKDCIIYVPVGTIIRYEGIICADLNYEGAEYVAAIGGIGGRGNASFVSQQRRFPGFAEKGEKVSDKWVELELRVLADIALVGFPNVGKSTIISKISASKPKIADYPFTTLVPNLGVVTFNEDSFVVADVPGLIEGAHKGVGLGDKFLRHVLRSKLIVFVLDASILLIKGKDEFLNTFNILRSELKLYNESLYKKPFFIVINKTDLISMQDLKLNNELEKAIKKLKSKSTNEVLLISAVTGKGVVELVKLMHEKLSAVRESQIRTEEVKEDYSPFKVYSVDNIEDFVKSGFNLKNKFNLKELQIVKSENEYIVKDKELERLVSMTDLENEEALDYLKDRLKKMGIGDKLKKMGVPIGSTVIIGDLVFELYDDNIN